MDKILHRREIFGFLNDGELICRAHWQRGGRRGWRWCGGCVLREREFARCQQCRSCTRANASTQKLSSADSLRHNF
jgi:hypothetical protein